MKRTYEEVLAEHVPELQKGMKWEDCLPLIAQALEDYAANIRRLIREKAFAAEKHSLLENRYSALQCSFGLLSVREKELERQLTKAVLRREGIGNDKRKA